MTSEIESLSPLDLDRRRQNLRTLRRWKMLQALWRTLAASGILGGLIWASTQPIWVLRAPSQITIEGDYLLKEQVIMSLIRLSYPQSMLRIEPAAIARALGSQPTIANASISRELFPPGLRVVVTERVPVAIAEQLQPHPGATNRNESVGLLDATGAWIPLEVYTAQSSGRVALPQLKVTGLFEDYRPYWRSLYQAIVHSPVKVSAIDCQDPENIILTTELGIVHLGAYSPKLTQQLQLLAWMRQLPKKVDPSQIAYIDLKDPAAVAVQTNEQKQVIKPVTP